MAEKSVGIGSKVGRGGKWELPGWRIEQKYCQGVLIGNWSEERLGKVRTSCIECAAPTATFFLPIVHHLIIKVSKRQRVWEQHSS